MVYHIFNSSIWQSKSYQWEVCLRYCPVYMQRGLSWSVTLLYICSGALVVQGSLHIQTSAFKAGMSYKAQAASLIDFQTDVDFSDKLMMCLQMSRPAFTYR